jgi:hypothetical protein
VPGTLEVSRAKERGRRLRHSWPAPPGRRRAYLVTRRYEDDPQDILNGNPPVRDEVRSFTTGTELRSSAVPDLALHVFGSKNGHGASTGRGQGMLLELYAETNSLEPLFVLARGETGPQLRDWDPDYNAEGPYRRPLGVVDCAQFTIDGRSRPHARERVAMPAQQIRRECWLGYRHVWRRVVR